MAGVVGFQEFLIPGYRFYFEVDEGLSVLPYYGGLMDFGVIKSVSPQGEVNQVTLIDGDGGQQLEVDQTILGVTQKLTVVLNNFNMDVWAILNMAQPPTDFVQTITLIPSVPHIAVIGAGMFVKLRAADGSYIYNINTVAVKSNDLATTYVENTDWRWYNKQRGIIQIIPGGAITHGQAIRCDITPNALTGKRLINPLTRTKIQGMGICMFSQNNFTDQWVREARMSLVPQAPSFGENAYGEATVDITILSKPIATNVPAGRFLKFAGNLPVNA